MEEILNCGKVMNVNETSGVIYKDVCLKKKNLIYFQSFIYRVVLI